MTPHDKNPLARGRGILHEVDSILRKLLDFVSVNQRPCSNPNDCESVVGDQAGDLSLAEAEQFADFSTAE